MTKKLKTPRAYMSWNQLSTYRSGKRAYIKQYLDNNKFEGNKYTAFGSYLADELEKEHSENPSIAFLKEILGGFTHREFVIDDVKLNGIPLLAKIDAFNLNTITLGEYKTGKHWDQRKVDKHDQLTFYGLCIYLKYGVIPREIKLYWLETEEDEDGEVVYTGRIEIFKTERTAVDYLKLGKEIERTWKDIIKLTKEYNESK